MTDPQPVQLVVYDLDGTLIDAFEDIWRCLSRAMEQFGLPTHSLETVRSYVGDGVEKLVERALGKTYEEYFDRVLPVFRRIYQANPCQYATVYPGVRETLKAVRARGIQQAILTNKPEAMTQRTCQHLGLDKLVDHIFGQVEGRPRKPDPETLRAVMRMFGVDASVTAMVGDGLPDERVARAAGTRFFAVGWGVTSPSTLRSLRPDAMVIEMADLLDHLAPLA